MDKLSAIMNGLECPVCFEYMVNEIVQCMNGHSICKKCRHTLWKSECPICKQLFGNTRNYALENVASNLSYPCKNQGCIEELNAADINNHTKICPFGVQPCMLNSTGCGWTGKMSQIKKHIENTHRNYIENWYSCGSKYVYVKFLNEETFIIFCECINFIQNISGMYMGAEKKADDYLLTIKYNDETKRGYSLQVSTPCISQCRIEDVFKKDKIYFSTYEEHTMLSKCFRPKHFRKGYLNYSITVSITTKERT